MLKAILFDFGGVLAEEGFRHGLEEIGRENNLNPARFYTVADDLIAETGYLTGVTSESAYWDAVRNRTGIRGTDRQLREKILKGFSMRKPMMACVDHLRKHGFMVALLSDQTNWLDEINAKEDLFRHFDSVLNSFNTHRTKRDASTFPFICEQLNVKPGDTLFIDDNRGHIDRAAEAGLHTIHFVDTNDFQEKLRRWTD